MTPAIAAALAFLAPLVQEAVLSAIRDAAELTDEERAARVDRLLQEVEEDTVHASVLEAAGRHRQALRVGRRVDRRQQHADRMAR